MLNLYLYTRISHLCKQALVYLQLVQYDFKSVKEDWVTIRCTVLLCLSAPENFQLTVDLTKIKRDNIMQHPFHGTNSILEKIEVNLFSQNIITDDVDARFIS